MPSTVEAAEQAERNLLSSLLADASGKTWLEATAILQPEDAITPAGRVILGGISRMVQSGKTLESSVLVSELLGNGSLMQVGGGTYIAELSSGAVKRASIRLFAEKLKDAANKKQLSNTCMEVIAHADESSFTFSECLETLNESVLSLSANGGMNQSVCPHEITADLLNDIEIERKCSGLLGLTTSIQELDANTTGIRAGEFWVVGALPGRGKTALMQQIASANARSGVPVGVFSMEMTKKQLLRRIWINEARYVGGLKFPSWKLRNPSMMDREECRALQRIAESALDWPLYIDDSSSLNISELIARAKLMIHQHGCKLICVDYLRLVNTPARTNLREGISLVADSLRQLAKDTGVPVLALSQLKRPADLNAQPTMIDLKESGDIEAHAHVVLLLYRHMENGKFDGQDEIIIGKCREGELIPALVTYSTEHLIFGPRV